MPVLFNALGFLLQCLAWWYLKDFSPQQRQYDVVVEYLYPEVDGADPVGVIFAADVDYRAMFRDLTKRPFGSIFAVIELATVVYVWGELLYPPVFCGSVRPLSLYYYPILISLLDLTKFNFYVATRLYQAKMHQRALFSALNLEMMVSNAWITTVLACLFVGGLMRDCVVRVARLVELCVHRLCGHGFTAWPSAADATNPDSAVGDTARSTTAETVNPMVKVSDVELLAAAKQTL